MDDLKLIELVQQHSCLYDVKNVYYKDNNYREDVWIEISTRLEQSIEDCKTRWKNIRDTYMKHRRNKKLPIGSARPRKKRKWHLEHYLTFLDQVQMERDAITNSQVPEDSGEDGVYENSLEQFENVKIETQEDAENQVIVHPFEMIEAIETTPQVFDNLNEEGLPNKKRKHSSGKMTTDRIADFLEKNSQDRRELLLQAIGKLNEQEHPIDMFFKSMATSVKALSPERQIQAKMQISKIIGELELEELSSRSSSDPLSSHLYYEQKSVEVQSKLIEILLRQDT